MMTLINAIALTLLAWLSAVGMAWLHANHIYTFTIVTYVIIGVGSSFATHRFLIGALEYRFFTKKIHSLTHTIRPSPYTSKDG